MEGLEPSRLNRRFHDTLTIFQRRFGLDFIFLLSSELVKFFQQVILKSLTPISYSYYNELRNKHQDCLILNIFMRWIINPVLL